MYFCSSNTPETLQIDIIPPMRAFNNVLVKCIYLRLINLFYRHVHQSEGVTVSLIEQIYCRCQMSPILSMYYYAENTHNTQYCFGGLRSASIQYIYFGGGNIRSRWAVDGSWERNATWVASPRRLRQLQHHVLFIQVVEWLLSSTWVALPKRSFANIWP